MITFENEIQKCPNSKVRALSSVRHTNSFTSKNLPATRYFYRCSLDCSSTVRSTVAVTVAFPSALTTVAVATVVRALGADGEHITAAPRHFMKCIHVMLLWDTLLIE
jgi:hypothetical protein